MDRILVALDALHPKINTIDFACRISSYAQARLSGLLVNGHLPDEFQSDDVVENFCDEGIALVATSKIEATNCTQLFHEECCRRGVLAEAIIDNADPLSELVFESRFADLLIIDPGFGNDKYIPTHLVKELLHRAECPVLLAPEQFTHLEEIVFCYDGSPSSVFAIKQFSYLLPQFEEKKVLLLEASSGQEDSLTQGHNRIVEWLSDHYQLAQYSVLKGNGYDELFNYFFMKKNKLIVMGAYGRGMISKLFRKSSAEELIRMVDLPIFISHH